MSNRPLVAIDLPIIASWISLVAEEVYLVVFDAAPSLLFLDVLEAVRLIPTGGENVKRNLTADGVCKAKVGEGFFQRSDHGGANIVLDVIGFVVVALLGGGVTANGGYVDHAAAELDKCAALDGDIEVGDVVEDPVNICLVQVVVFLPLSLAVVELILRPAKI